MEYIKLLKYPHLMANESVIWGRFIEQNPRFFNSVDYDVLVGQGQEPGEEESEEHKRNIAYLSRKKIDVVGHQPTRDVVVEIRERAGLEIVGKVISYLSLFRETSPSSKVVVGAIVTDREMPDIKALAQKMGILYFLA